MTIKAADAKQTFKLLNEKKVKLIEMIDSLKGETNPQALATKVKLEIRLETIQSVLESLNGNNFNLGIL